MHHHWRIVTEVVATTDCTAMHHGLTTQYPGGIVARSRLRASRFRLSEKKTTTPRIAQHHDEPSSQIIMVLSACLLIIVFRADFMLRYTATHNGSRICRERRSMFYFYATFGLHGLVSRTISKKRISLDIILFFSDR